MPTSLHWNLSLAGNAILERQSVTNLLDEYTNYHDIALYDTIFNRFYNLTAALEPGNTSDKLLSDVSVTPDGKVRVVWVAAIPENGLNVPEVLGYTFQRVNTPVGLNVTAMAPDLAGVTAPVTMNFANVTSTGITSLISSSTGAPPPGGFQPGVPALYYDVATTASFIGSATICINYAGITFTQPPQLFHILNGTPVNITTSVDTTNMVVCGMTTSFSPFVLFQPSVVPTTSAISAPGVTYGTATNVTVSVNLTSGTPTVTGNVTLTVDGGGASTMALSNGSAIFAVGVLSAGSHSLAASFGAQGSFAASTATGTLTVSPAALTVTAANAQRLYGQANPTFSGSVTGIQNGDNITATYATSATPASPAGTYAIVPTLTDPNNKLGNYTVTLNNGTLTVTPAALTIRANNARRVVDAPNPPFSATYSGFVNGDTAASLSGSINCTTTATPTSPVGNYPINCAGQTSTNYAISYVPGTLTVTATISSIGNLIADLLGAGCIDNSGIAVALTSKLSAAQTALSGGNVQTAINTLAALKNQISAQAAKHIVASCAIGGVTLNPAAILLLDVQGLIDSLKVAMIPDPIIGYVISSSGFGVPGTNVSILDVGGSTVAMATTDITGLYFFPTTGLLTTDSNYTVAVTGFPAGAMTSTPAASPGFTWTGTGMVIGNFVLN